MTVQIQLFARLRELCDNQSRVALRLADGATAADAFSALSERFDGVDRFRDTLAVAVNDEYASWGHVLSDGDSLALIPPVSGGRP